MGELNDQVPVPTFVRLPDEIPITLVTALVAFPPSVKLKAPEIVPEIVILPKSLTMLDALAKAIVPL